MNPSRSGAFGRGVLYVLIAIGAAALADDWLKAIAAPWVLFSIKMVAIAAGAWRLYIDQSISQARVAIESASRFDDGSTLDTGGENHGDES